MARKKKAERQVWLGASRSAARLGQTITVSWRSPGQPGEFLSLWQEGPDGSYHWSVPAKGSRQLQPTAGGTFRFSLHGLAGEELASHEVRVRT